ncbi:MAG: ABC transporter permease [Nitrososphaerales archaeon]|nr:ABC transporter permease [Nitrososphaerales archaeon]
MRKVIAVVDLTLRSWFRIRSAVFFSILFPIMLLLIFSTVFGGDNDPSFSLFVQNLDTEEDGESSDMSKVFLEILNSTDVFNISEIPADADANSFAKDEIGPLGGVYRILIIPEGFGSNIVLGAVGNRISVTQSTIQMLLQEERSPGTPILGQQEKEQIAAGGAVLDNVVGEVALEKTHLVLVFDPSDTSGQVVYSILLSVTDSFSNGLIGVGESISFDRESISQDTFSAVDYYLPGLIGAFVMSTTVIGITSQNTEFRKRGIIKRLSLTPLSRSEWIIGSILAQTVLAFILTLMMFAVGWAVLGVTAVPNLLVVAMVIAGAIQFSGLGMLIAGLIKDIESANAASNAIVLPMMFLSGAFFPLDSAPEFIRIISSLLPLKYLIDGLRFGLISGFPEGAIISLAITFGLAVVFVIIGSITTKWQEA